MAWGDVVARTTIVIVFACIMARRPVTAAFEETLLAQGLLSNYSVSARPVKDYERTIAVKVGFDLMKVNEVNEKKQQMVLMGWLRVMWTDEKLTWDPSRYAGISTVVIDTQNIWTPDLALLNSDGNNMYDVTHSKHFFVEVTSTGQVKWFPGGKFTVSCPLSLSDFPFDIQSCSLIFESWNYPIKFVRYELDVDSNGITLAMSKAQSNGEWALINGSATLKEQDYGLQMNYSRVEFSVVVQRKYMFYFMTIIFPCMILSSLGFLAFLLPASLENKVDLGTTILLSFSVFQLVVAEQMPRTSDTTPLLGVYIIWLMGTIALSVAASICLCWLYHQDDYNNVPGWLWYFASKILARILFVKIVLPTKPDPRMNAENILKTIRSTTSEVEKRLAIRKSCGYRTMPGMPGDATQLNQTAPLLVNFNAYEDMTRPQTATANQRNATVRKLPSVDHLRVFESIDRTRTTRLDDSTEQDATRSFSNAYENDRNHCHRDDEQHEASDAAWRTHILRQMDIIQSLLKTKLTMFEDMMRHHQRKRLRDRTGRKWRLVAHVFDRLCLVVFTVLTVTPHVVLIAHVDRTKVLSPTSYTTNATK